MASRVYCRQGDINASETDLTVYTGRKGVPMFDTDGKTPLIQLGHRWAQGQSNLGTFTLEDPNGELTTGGFNVPSGTLLTWTEDAAGCAYWLARGRVASRDAGRGAALAASEQEYSVTVEDGNKELRGTPFTEDWVRPAETDYARLVALQQYILNGSLSTAPHPRKTVNVTVHDTHLAKNASTVLMGAKTYPKETQPIDVVADCAATAGKDYGAVIHHGAGGGASTLLEFWTWDGGTDTYTLHAANAYDGADHAQTGAAVQCGAADEPGGGTEGTNCYDRVSLDAGTSQFKASPGDVVGASGSVWPYWNVYSGTYGQLIVTWYDSSGSAIGYEGVGDVMAQSGGAGFPGGYWHSFAGTSGAAPAGTARFALRVVQSPATGVPYTTGAPGVGRTYWRDQWRIYRGGLPSSGGGIGSDVGNCSHLCLQYLVPTDLTTNPCTLKISDQRADINEDTTSPPTVLAPRWLQGKATTADGQTLLSALLYEYQTTSGSGAVFTEDTTRTSLNDYWADTLSDSLVSTPAEAGTRAVKMLGTRSLEHDTHRVSIPIAADQINKITCGMSIQIKAVSVAAGANLGVYQTRRIVQLVWEPRNDGYYWAHLELNRPERLAPTATQIGPNPGTPSKATITSGTYAGQTVQQVLETLNTATPLTTLGDMLYRGAGGSNTRLAIGASNTHLTSDGSKPVWSPQSGSGSSTTIAPSFDISPPQALAMPPRVKPTGSGVITADPQGRLTVLNDTNYKSFPGMAYLEGRLHLVYRSGTAHNSSGGTINYQYSDNLGQSWSTATTIVTPTAGDDCRDPNLLAMSSGRLLLSYDYQSPWNGSAIGTRIRYSDNRGQTWSAAYTPPNGLGSANEFDVTSPAIELPNGTVLLPGYGDFSGKYRSWVWSSTDGGLTFTGPVLIASDATLSLSETTLRYLASGEIVALIREETTGHTYRSVSTDLGVTWSAKTDVLTTIGGRPDFVELWPNVLLWFGRGTSFRSRWAVSWDKGVTWTALQETDSGGTLNSEYHSPVVLTPGYVAVVYSLENSSSDADLFIRYYYDGYGIDTLGNIIGLTVSPGTDPMTTIGDIIVRNASNVTARLGIGASNTVLTALGTGAAPVWSSTLGIAGFRELVMQDGVSAPPVPLENEARTDWLYSDTISN